MGFSLDLLEFCDERNLPKLNIAGWAVARGRPILAIRFQAGAIIQDLAISESRNDVLAAFPGEIISPNCGFRGMINVSCLGSEFSLTVVAVQEADSESGATIIWLGEILGQQRRMIETPINSALAPISLTALGRSGSTLMMQILNAHPEIVVAGDYPLETRYAQNSFHAMSDNLERVLSEGRQVLELAGLYERFCEDTRQRLSRTAATIVDLYYSSVAESQEKKKTRYFAEKSLPFFLPNISRDLYGWKAKEILVVRDPRDIFCSATQFNKKRGTSAFSASYYEKDTAWFRFLCHSFVHVANRHHRLGAEALTIRYEDLILDERNAISKIMHFLQVCDDDATLAAIQDRIRQAGDVFSDHKTSTTPRHSVSRWRSYEDKNIFTFEDKQYLESMRMFGYL